MDLLIETRRLFAGLGLGLDPGRRGLHIIDGSSKAQNQRHQNQHGRNPQDDERLGGQIAKEVEKEPGLGVEHEDIALPDQVGVNETDHKQPEDAAIIDPANPGSATSAR